MPNKVLPQNLEAMLQFFGVRKQKIDIRFLSIYFLAKVGMYVF